MLPGTAVRFTPLPRFLSVFKALLLGGLCPTTLFKNCNAPTLASFLSVAQIWSSGRLVYRLLGCRVPEDCDLQEGRDFVGFVDC